MDNADIPKYKKSSPKRISRKKETNILSDGTLVDEKSIGIEAN